MVLFWIMFVYNDCSYLNVFLLYVCVGYFMIKECFGYNIWYFKNYVCINMYV